MRVRCRRFEKASKSIIWSDFSQDVGDYKSGESTGITYIREALIEFLGTVEPSNVYSVEYGTDNILVYYREAA